MLTALILVTALLQAAPAVESQRDFRAGVAAYEDFEFIEARHHFEALARDKGLSDAERAKVLLWVGMCFAEEGALGEAVRHFEAAAAADLDVAALKGMSPKARKMLEAARQKVAAQTPEPAPPEPQPTPPSTEVVVEADGGADADDTGGVSVLVPVGVGVVGVGALAAVVGLAAGAGAAAAAADAETDSGAVAARTAYEGAQGFAAAANVCFGVAAVAVVVGGAVAVAGAALGSGGGD